MDLRNNKVKKQLREHLLEIVEQRLISSFNNVFTEVSENIVDSIRFDWQYAYMYNSDTKPRYWPWANDDRGIASRKEYKQSDFTHITIDAIVNLCIVDNDGNYYELRKNYTLCLNWNKYIKPFIREEKLKSIL